MDPTYQEIADLFGIIPPSGSEMVDDNLADATPQELGQQRLMEGQYEKAIKHFRDAVEQSKGESEEALLDLAGAYSAGEMLPQAYRQFLKAKRLKQEDPEPYLGIADILRREGRLDESIAELEKAMDLEPQNAYPHYKMAEALASAGHRQRAIRAMHRAILLAPDDAFYHYWLAELLIECKRFDEAIESLRAAVEMSPGDDHLYIRTAVAFWGAGRHQDAVKAALLASDLNTESAVYQGLMVKMHQALGQLDEAEILKSRMRKLDDYDFDKLLKLLRDAELEK